MTDETIAIIGSRLFDPEALDTYVELALGPHRGRVVSGGARGPDTAAERKARKASCTVVSYRPWKRQDGTWTIAKRVNGSHVEFLSDRHGAVVWWPTFAEAAKERNWMIVREATRVEALWDGVSSGTAHAIAAAARLGRPVRIWMVGDS